MPKPQTVKCRQCGQSQPKSASIQLPNRFWFCCQECANKWLEEHKNSGKPVKSEPKPKEEYSPLRKLTDYVQTYAPDTDWVKFVQYVKKLKDENGITPSQIHYCLWFIREHEQISIEGSGIGLVLWFIEQSRAYYNWHKKMQQVVADWRLEDNNVEIVKKEKEEDVFV